MSRDKNQETAQDTKSTLTFCVYLCKVSAKVGGTDTTVVKLQKPLFYRSGSNGGS